MRYLSFFYLLFFIAEINWAQPHSPATQVQFYFEDALGNKDSIMVSGDTILIPGVGFDYSAYRGDTVTAPNPKKKFEVFSVPISNIIYSDLVFTPYVYYNGIDASKLVYYKNVVIDYRDSLYSAESLFLLFKCKNYPVTVKWDYTYYASLQGYNGVAVSHFLPDHTRYSSPDIFPWEHYTITKFKCLRHDGIWTFHLGDDADYNRPWQKVFGFFNPQDTLYGLLLNFSPYFNCSEVSGTENYELESSVVASAALTPNPVSDHLRVQLQFKDQLEGMLTLTDATGRILKDQHFGDSGLDVRYEMAQYPAGVYFVLLRTAAETHAYAVIKY